MTLKRKLINTVKSLLGIQSIHGSFKKIKIRIQKLICKEKYSVDDLLNLMKEMGMQKGSIICLHSSMREMYNYQGSVEEIIDGILNEIGNEGTLMMSVIPQDLSHNEVVDFRKRKCRTGIIAETFRNYEDVHISYNLYHSVCAKGKYAEYLTNTHHKSYTCWDKMSPYWKLADLHGLVFNLGMGKNYIGTVSHVPESILRERYPYFAQLFNHEFVYSYYDAYRQIQKHRLLVGEGIERIPSKNYYVVSHYFDPSQYEIRYLSNLCITRFNADYVVDRLLELAARGIVVYSEPKAKKELFEKTINADQQ